MRLNDIFPKKICLQTKNFSNPSLLQYLVLLTYKTFFFASTEKKLIN